MFLDVAGVNNSYVSYSCKSLVAFFFPFYRKQSYLEGKTFSGFVSFTEINDTVNCTFITELFLAI